MQSGAADDLEDQFPEKNMPLPSSLFRWHCKSTAFTSQCRALEETKGPEHSHLCARQIVVFLEPTAQQRSNKTYIVIVGQAPVKLVDFHRLVRPNAQRLCRNRPDHMPGPGPASLGRALTFSWAKRESAGSRAIGRSGEPENRRTVRLPRHGTAKLEAY